MSQPHIEHVTLTQQKLYNDAALNEINELFEFVDQRLENIEAQVTRQELYYDAKRHNQNVLQMFGFVYSNNYLRINELQFEQAALGQHYTITIQELKKVITNISDMYLLVGISIYDQSAQFIYDNGSQNVLQQNSNANMLPTWYVFIEPNQKLLIDYEIANEDITVFTQPILPVLKLQYTDYHKEILNLTDIFNTRFYYSELGSTQLNYQSSILEPDNEYEFITNIQLSEFTAPIINKYGIDWANSLIITGSQDGIQSYGKYIYEKEGQLYKRYTYTINTGANKIDRVTDQATGYNVLRPYKHITEYGQSNTIELDLKLCKFEDYAITFLNGSGGTVTELTQKRVYSVSELQVTGEFIIVYIQDGTAYSEYYNTQTGLSTITLKATPEKVWLITDISGFQLPSGALQNVEIIYPAQQLVVFNKNQPVTTIVDNAEKPVIVGGQPADYIKQFVTNPSDKHDIEFQNYSDSAANMCIFIIEQKSLVTPLVQTNYGFKYTFKLIDTNGTQINNYAANIQLTNDNYDKVLGVVRQKFTPVDQNQHILVNYKVSITQTQTDQTIILAQKKHKLTWLVAELKPGVLIYEPIEIGALY